MKEHSLHPSNKMHTWYVYFTGHGVQCNTSYIVLNEFEVKKRYFSIELNLSTYANLFKNNTLFLALDCCRETITQEKMKEVNTTNVALYVQGKGKGEAFKAATFRNFMI